MDWNEMYKIVSSYSEHGITIKEIKEMKKIKEIQPDENLTYIRNTIYC